MDTVECLVVGAGVVGLAVARALALQGREVVVAEAAGAIGTGVSSRNSEVIHAGIYYPKGSLKAELCVEGRNRLYDFCSSRGIAHRRCGKLIVASAPEQTAQLEAIAAAAAANGVDDLRRLSGGEARALEPELNAVGALYSPSTGIIDSHGYMLSLQGEAEAHGAAVAFGTSVSAVAPVSDGLSVCFNDEPEPQLLARFLVNAAGLQAPKLAAATLGLGAEHRPQARFAKGSYFMLSRRSPFQRLVYPVPEPGGLGVHLTIDLAGQARFGPDVEWIEDVDFEVDAARAERFYAAIRAYWPALEDGALTPAYAGVRPKISGPGEPAADFRIDGPSVHAVPGLINLFGIESPGLTASLALADRVAGMIHDTKRRTRLTRGEPDLISSLETQ